MLLIGSHSVIPSTIPRKITFSISTKSNNISLSSFPITVSYTHLGIAALPFGWFVPIIGIILGIAAIILSILGMGKNRDLRGAAIAGLIISILATIFSIGVIVYAVINVSKTLSNAGKELFDNSGITSDLDDFDFDSDSDDSDDYDDSDYSLSLIHISSAQLYNMTFQ